VATPGITPAALAARLFRGFADPTRVAVLLTLLGGERRVSDLIEAVGGSQSNVSGHLACLRDCGLVVDRPGERRQVFYRLAGPEVVELLQAAERLLAATGTRIELCQNPLVRQASNRHG
jgi:DNA-binding transcriptional ArsR family regulator